MASDVPAELPTGSQPYCDQLASGTEKMEKTEQLYASGECALQRLRFREAIGHFSELLALDPNPVFRAELGRSFLGAQEFERAREQFLLALQSDPPDQARTLLNMFIQMADQQKTQAKEWFASAVLGTLFDSNINSGPLSPDVMLYGLPFTMGQDSMPKSDHALHMLFSVVQNRTLGNGASWQSDASLDTVSYAVYSSYDTRQLNIDTGPHIAIAGGNGDLYLPLGVSRTSLGGNGYSATVSLAPQVSYRLALTDLLITSPSFARTTYDKASARDANAASLGLSWRHQLGEDWTFEPSLKVALEHAEDHAFANKARSAGLSVSGSLPYGVRFAAYTLATWADYREPESWADTTRKDRRRSTNLSLTKYVAGGYYATLSVQDSRTYSNLGLYSTAKRQAQLQLSKSL